VAAIAAVAVTASGLKCDNDVRTHRSNNLVWALCAA
jgi:hypothetical protein